MALTVPALAAAMVYLLVAHEQLAPGRSDELWRISVICFSIVGACNGYLLAIATGDFGRSLIALPL